VRPAQQGTTYVTAGGGGQVAYQASPYPLSYVTIPGGVRVPEAAPWSSVRYLDLSFIALDVTPPGADGRTTMALRALKPDGAVVDTITFERTRSVSLPVPSTGVRAAGAQQGGTLPATGGAGVVAGLAAAGAAAAARMAQRKIADR
jgi:hypothetical protein